MLFLPKVGSKELNHAACNGSLQQLVINSMSKPPWRPHVCLNK